jgi:Fur family peroxide stress response transcriptional regulator
MQKEPDRELLNFFMIKCGEHHLRVTPQRLAIYRLLSESQEHPSADDVFQNIKREFPSISYDTVNRTLLTFSKIGVVGIVEGHGEPRRFDPNMNRHHHFHCSRCGTITDFSSDDYDNLEVPRDLEEKFTVLEKRVVLQGVCDKCIAE